MLVSSNNVQTTHLLFHSPTTNHRWLCIKQHSLQPSLHYHVLPDVHELQHEQGNAEQVNGKPTEKNTQLISKNSWHSSLIVGPEQVIQSCMLAPIGALT